eukprot:TRINITY_DN4682_c0_g1_i2.p1 TRINITY_DN4682_c0_g1~~TRINITY_DN4682_c0_g1_i2.p1  ORF type:complete len:541 (+),score=80.14 TRINITY_DN4682_c0_g1_i2:98-1720(+)
MENPSRGPRANRSKKTLPAAFFNQNSRHAPSLDTGGGGGGVTVSGEKVSPRGLPPPYPPRNDAVSSVGGDASDWPPEAEDPSIRLDSLVFLSFCPQRHGHFAIKKMLHSSTMELFCLLEIPASEHQRAVLRNGLEEWISRWCELQAEYPTHLVALRETCWDSPQCHILCDYMPLGSLEELIQACGGLPEEAMKELAQVVLEALHVLHSVQPPVVHGCLKPSQVLFDANGRPRLTFGLEQRIKACQVWHGDLGGDAVDGQADGARDQSTAVDVFDLGLLMLVSALGGMDVLLDAIPYARKFGSQSNLGPGAPLSAVSADTCSLLLHELRSGCAAEATAGPDMGYLPPASDLLFNRRYSGPFLAFVSTCLEAHTQSTPVSAGDLLQHEFFHTENQDGPLVSLKEMQSLARLMNEAPEHDPSRFGPHTRRSLVPGVAPSVAQSSQLYLMNIAQSIAPYCCVAPTGGVIPAPAASSHDHSPTRPRAMSDTVSQPAGRPRWRQEQWEIMLTDTARTLGLSRFVVQNALETQLERLVQQQQPHHIH